MMKLIMNQRFAAKFAQFMPKAAVVLLIVQIFSSLSFGLVTTNLVSFTMKYLHISSTDAITLTTNFLGFDFALHLVGGFIGGRLVSYRTLFALGIGLQIIAAIFLTSATTNTIYFGLAAFLAGVGLNFPCINCMLLQLFKAEDKRREMAFLWNYSGVSLGLLLSFIILHTFSVKDNFTTLFLISALSSFIVLLCILSNWQKLADRTTLIMTFTKDTLITALLKGILFILILFAILFYLLKYVHQVHYLLLSIVGIMVCLFIFLAYKQPTTKVRNRILAALIFAIITVGFWTLYMLSPVVLAFFTQKNMDPHLFSIPIPLPWFNDISMATLSIGGFLLSLLFQLGRQKGHLLSLPVQFTIALCLLSLAFFAVPLGIKMTSSVSLVNSGWLISSYILQALVLLFIQPIGYAMIGQLIPIQLQGLMMGTWLMLSGIGATIANLLQHYDIIAIPHDIIPSVPKSFYFTYFNKLGWMALIIVILMTLLIPLLKKLIQYRSLNPIHN